MHKEISKRDYTWIILQRNKERKIPIDINISKQELHKQNEVDVW